MTDGQVLFVSILAIVISAGNTWFSIREALRSKREKKRHRGDGWR